MNGIVNTNTLGKLIKVKIYLSLHRSMKVNEMKKKNVMAREKPLFPMVTHTKDNMTQANDMARVLTGNLFPGIVSTNCKE